MSLPASRPTPQPGPPSTFAADVRAGLTHAPQKELPSMYLYDEVGSALFEVITVLPEYGVTRAEERLLTRYANEIVDALPADVKVAELGSGSGRKTRRILEALCRKRPTAYCPIEISRTALQLCRRELADIERISIVGYERDYLAGLAEVSRQRKDGERLFVLFLGSTIGNFARLAATRFLRDIRAMLRPGDTLLLGTDLVKPVDTLIAAYDDSIGATAAFNLNLLSRINRELDGDFDLHDFEHVARFNPDVRSVEMHLRAKRHVEAHVGAARLSIELEPGETIWTESSHKYHADEIPAIAADAGFDCAHQWVEKEWGFAESLLAVR
ncbi:L-histidine N(alpha)-methyltransferase [Paraburkholderia tropica]|uniref:L-histidine N(alpha)-methyltransferase n=1 Tax=Paraburkholderia tropica TaxID=92647 RepID=UPI0007EDDF02|nr:MULTISPECIES: L-histidine N(alpha)-methyltransferase [Paraburkholderia]MBB2978565.1 dimethylhistidine N-methyltransferase [Paraburkholderia tropica]OBR49687.1 dimethylhistidine N-methyltransferase [Paraburkholderia tropica]QNB13982.1 L-histidine N(alpha)-methyltransferase [Paraburkholderia tropica]RQM50215.1 L-histidine N(alpha)-methyltransferase [Paraburkholderia bannensis]